MSLSQDEVMESLERTLAEIEALEAIYGCADEEDEAAATATTTNSFSVLSQPALQVARKMVEDGSPGDQGVPSLEVEIVCQIEQEEDSSYPLVLQCCLPAGYPELQPSRVVSVKPSTTTTTTTNGAERIILNQQTALITRLNETATTLLGAEAVMELVETLKELAPEYCQVERTRQEESKSSNNETLESNSATASHEQLQKQLHVISSHHLLNHAPDNFLAKGGTKFKLTGLYRFGTPGLAFCITDDSLQVENFQAALESKMPQKKFELVLSRDITDENNIVGWEEATMDQLRALLSPEEFTDLLKLQGAAAAVGGGTTTTRTSKTKGLHNHNVGGCGKKKGKKKKKGCDCC